MTVTEVPQTPYKVPLPLISICKHISEQLHVITANKTRLEKHDSEFIRVLSRNVTHYVTTGHSGACCECFVDKVVTQTETESRVCDCAAVYSAASAARQREQQAHSDSLRAGIVATKMRMEADLRYLNQQIDSLEKVRFEEGRKSGLFGRP